MRRAASWECRVIRVGQFTMGGKTGGGGRKKDSVRVLACTELLRETRGGSPGILDREVTGGPRKWRRWRLPAGLRRYATEVLSGDEPQIFCDPGWLRGESGADRYRTGNAVARGLRYRSRAAGDDGFQHVGKWRETSMLRWCERLNPLAGAEVFQWADCGTGAGAGNRTDAIGSKRSEASDRGPAIRVRCGEALESRCAHYLARVRAQVGVRSERRKIPLEGK